MSVYFSHSVRADWVQIGPWGAGIQVLAMSGNTIFAGTLNGLFLSSDNGTNWNQTNNGLTNNYINTFFLLAEIIYTLQFGVMVFFIHLIMVKPGPRMNKYPVPPWVFWII